MAPNRFELKTAESKAVLLLKPLKDPKFFKHIDLKTEVEVADGHGGHRMQKRSAYLPFVEATTEKEKYFTLIHEFANEIPNGQLHLNTGVCRAYHFKKCLGTQLAAQWDTYWAAEGGVATDNFDNAQLQLSRAILGPDG